MTDKAKNSLTLYQGRNPETIEQLLILQDASVVAELKDYFCVKTNSELAFQLSLKPLISLN